MAVSVSISTSAATIKQLITTHTIIIKGISITTVLVDTLDMIMGILLLMYLEV